MTHAILTDERDPLTARVSFIAKCGEVIPGTKAVSQGDFLTLNQQVTSAFAKAASRPSWTNAPILGTESPTLCRPLPLPAS